MRSYEQLGVFYLGQRHDLTTGARTGDALLYDSKDLVTHGVCVGMTGSGKTGLGIALIEEAAIDGVPVLAIDPKGDLANLLLTFPDLAPADFAPWVDPAEAAAQGTTVERLAARQATAWREGLAAWDQAPDRIARLRAAADVRVYTPGSRAGVPLALLTSLTPPSGDDPEDSAARVAGTATSLLALAGVDSPGPHSRDQALLSALLTHAATAGVAADLPWLVQQIQRPSFDTRRRARRRHVLPDRKSGRNWRCASTAFWRRPASTSGSPASRSISRPCCTPRPAGRASPSSRSRISARPNG